MMLGFEPVPDLIVTNESDYDKRLLYLIPYLF